MGEIEDIASKIVNAFEDYYFDEEKREVFDGLFNRYLSMVSLENEDPYEALVDLGRHYPFEFDQMVKQLRARSLIAD